MEATTTSSMIELKCQTCGAIYHRHPSVARTSRYCSWECMWKKRRGDQASVKTLRQRPSYINALPAKPDELCTNPRIAERRKMFLARYSENLPRLEKLSDTVRASFLLTHGVGDGRCLTMEAAGAELAVTRQCVNQYMVKAIRILMAPEKTCEGCGVRFYRPEPMYRIGVGRFCTKKCEREHTADLQEPWRFPAPAKTTEEEARKTFDRYLKCICKARETNTSV